MKHVKTFFHLLLGTTVTFGGLYAGDAKYLDNYTEEARLFGVAGEKEHIDRDLEKRLKAPYYFVAGHKSYVTPGFAYDFADKQNGDFSLTYTPATSQNADKFGFMSNLWGLYPTLDESYSLNFD